MPDPAPAAELLDDAAGYLAVEVRLPDGSIHPATLDVFDAYRRYCDRVGEATADDRDRVVREWAAAELGTPAVSGMTAAKLSHLVVDRVQGAAKKPGPRGSTDSTSPASPAPPPPAS